MGGQYNTHTDTAIQYILRHTCFYCFSAEDRRIGVKPALGTFEIYTETSWETETARLAGCGSGQGGFQVTIGAVYIGTVSPHNLTTWRTES
jgi:hypothetical protein